MVHVRISQRPEQRERTKFSSCLVLKLKTDLLIFLSLAFAGNSPTLRRGLLVPVLRTEAML